MDKLKLTDLVSIDILQEIQDFCVMRNKIATGISSADGEYLTTACYDLSDFCEKYIKQTPEGKRRCDECDCSNANHAMTCGKAMPYICHAGLIDFTGPISIDGELYGYIVGGQVCTERPTREKTDALAAELGIDPDDLYEAACKLKVLSKEELDGVMGTVNRMADLISAVAQSKLKVIEASKEVETAAQMKSDFLANMSHEIRTPMNAIIGMADMALRQDLSEDARAYIRQIKRSGNSLLAIINDILDFSKIESGKLDITLVDYEPVQIVNDVSNIILTRIGDKPVEYVVDLPLGFPGSLMGDDNRIKQIITNLANNAVKFTDKGMVKLIVGAEKTGDNAYQMTCAVQDTGIGIKKDDLEKIFNSFQQVDSKRNRNIEGTGLGLAISKQLVGLMGGTISVESEYEAGSVFSFTIPQLVLQPKESSTLENPDKIYAGTYLDNEVLEEQLVKDLAKLKIRSSHIDTDSDIAVLSKLIDEGLNYIFAEVKDFSDAIKDLIDKHPDVTLVLLLNYTQDVACESKNVVLMHKPAHLYQLISLFNHESLIAAADADDGEVQIDFEAPEAKVLVVDDNAVNLAVAAGLMQPMHMQIDTVESGMQCLDSIGQKKYDIIFMDHMMPQMDGVETTHIIRRMHPEYDNVPIIALTANALEEAKSMFLVEGMNDFMAKPINMKDLIKILKSWLPAEKIRSIQPQTPGSDSEPLPDIPDLKVADAVKLVGTVALYKDILKNYYCLAPRKRHAILSAYEAKDWPNYAIEVHALKSSSRQIGAMDLGNLAEALEMAGKAADVSQIEAKTFGLIAEYDHIVKCLEPHVEITREEKPSLGECDISLTLTNLTSLVDALEELDFTAGEEILEALKKYRYPEDQQACLNALSDAIELMDVDTCEEHITRWKSLIE